MLKTDLWCTLTKYQLVDLTHKALIKNIANVKIEPMEFKHIATYVVV